MPSDIRAPRRKPMHGPPSPFCDNGHKRTGKSARWRVVMYKGEHRYMQVSCRICESQRYRLYYRKRVLARLRIVRGTADANQIGA